jgi:hypothetical protein
MSAATRVALHGDTRDAGAALSAVLVSEQQRLVEFAPPEVSRPRGWDTVQVWFADSSAPVKPTRVRTSSCAHDPWRATVRLLNLSRLPVARLRGVLSGDHAFLLCHTVRPAIARASVRSFGEI